jgi:hypothetical protein
MKLTKFTITACCGRTSIIYKTDKPILKEYIAKLVNLGFKEHDNFTKAGILYLENQNVIIQSPIGSDRIQIKLKQKADENVFNQIEELLSQI